MNALWAVLFSLLAPGAGQVFNGQFVWGALVIFFFALGKSFVLPLILRFFALTNEARGLKIIYVFNIVYMATVALSIIYAAVFSTAENSSFILCFVLVLCVRAVQINTLNENIFYMLCGNNNYFKFVRARRQRGKLPSEN